MSVIAVRVRNGKIKIAADSQFTTSDNVALECSNKTKIKVIKGMILASVGICEEHDMFFWYAKSNKLPLTTEKGIFDYMVNFYKKRNEVNDCLKSNLDISQNAYILVLKGSAFAVGNTFVVELKNGQYKAYGAGWELATGAMGAGADPKEAVEIACRYNIYCGFPAVTYEVKYGK